MGYGIALNADHYPWNLLPWDILKNNPDSTGTLENNQTDNEVATPQQNINTSAKSDGPTPENREISSSEARSRADNYIMDPGASSGTPENVDIGGKDTYVVPVESNGTRVGEIHIDPETGENVGGAGGAPSYNFSK